MKCKKCGSDISRDQKFCGVCGAPAPKRRWPLAAGAVLGVALAAVGVTAALALAGVIRLDGLFGGSGPAEAEAEAGKVAIDPLSLVDISFNEEETTKSGEQTIEATATLPCFDALMRESLDEDDPEEFMAEHLNNGDYDVVDVACEVTVVRANGSVAMVDGDAEKEAVLESELIKAVNALTEDDAR